MVMNGEGGWEILNLKTHLGSSLAEFEGLSKQWDESHGGSDDWLWTT